MHVRKIIAASSGRSQESINCIRCIYRSRSACSATNRTVIVLTAISGREHPSHPYKLKYPYTVSCVPTIIRCGWSHWKGATAICWVNAFTESSRPQKSKLMASKLLRAENFSGKVTALSTFYFKVQKTKKPKKKQTKQNTANNDALK